MTRHVLVRSVLTFLLVTVSAGWPNDALRFRASQALSGLLIPFLSALEFGHGGRAELQAAPVRSVRRVTDQVSSDATLHLRVDGARQQLSVGVNLRRDFYLPLVVFIATVLAYPASRRRRVAALVLGFPCALYASLGALYGTICWLFAHRASEVYPLSDTELALLDRVMGTFVAPPTLRFFVPILIAVAMLTLLRKVEPHAQRADSGAPRFDDDQQPATEQ